MTRRRKYLLAGVVIVLVVGLASFVPIHGASISSTIQQMIMLNSLPSGASVDSTIKQVVCVDPVTFANVACSGPTPAPTSTPGPTATPGPITARSLGVNATPPSTAGDIDILSTDSSNTLHMCVNAVAANVITLGYGTCPTTISTYGFGMDNLGDVLINATTSQQVIVRVNNANRFTLGNTSASFVNGIALQSTGGSAPTLTAGCNGAGSSVLAGSTNNRGQFTTSSGAATTCTLTFSAGGVWLQAPFCVVSDGAASITPTSVSVGAISTATMVIDFASASSKVFNYICM